MEIILNPKPILWKSLVQRPTIESENIDSTINKVFDDVEKSGDGAIKKYTSIFDQVEIDEFQISAQEIAESESLISEKLKQAILVAKNNIEKFHLSQKEEPKKIETSKGVVCWRESRAIESVGIYIPGGTAPLFSTVLMLGIPAKIAGCPEIVLCTPPNKEKKVHPAILYVANLIGITKIIKVGGIQAIAGLTFGTKSIPKVNKIFGPGNQYVTQAKQKATHYGVAIDMPAGPSEVLVIADSSAVPSFVASDLLSQAEHGNDSQVILLCNDRDKIAEIHKEIYAQLKDLPRQDFAMASLKNSKSIYLESIDDIILFSNLYAPEHLIIACENAENLAQKINNAGSVFLGNYSCESAGDYASGTNHTLPTHGFARNYSGVSLDSFVKKITFQHLTKEGLQSIAQAVEEMAEAEGLMAHKNAVSVRFQ